MAGYGWIWLDWWPVSTPRFRKTIERSACLLLLWALGPLAVSTLGQTPSVSPAPPRPPFLPIPSQHASPTSTPEVDRVDYLTFAQGAVPLRVGAAGAQLGVGDEQALRSVDGSPATFTLVTGAKPETDIEFVYELPAPTTFDRFAVPNVIESPGAAQTFARRVEVLGSSTGPDAGYTVLAEVTLTAHARRGEVSELTITDLRPVRWVKLRLVGGLDLTTGESAIEFSELIGNGTQEPAQTVYRFRGEWLGRGVALGLRQTGPVVSGCYDTAGELSGTVSGNILRATGINRADKVASTFVLAVAADGTIRGVRSIARGPFKLYTAPKTPSGATPRCVPPLPTLACGAVIHGIDFDIGSADIRPEAAPLLTALVNGLRTAAGASASASVSASVNTALGIPSGAAVVIEGHTANDADAAANQLLSLRRAQAVVAELVRRGIAADRLRATGVGSARPIAANDDEYGRALNRRIEVRCP